MALAHSADHVAAFVVKHLVLNWRLAFVINLLGLLIRRRRPRNLTREKASGLADRSWQKPQKLPRPGKLSTGAGAAT